MCSINVFSMLSLAVFWYQILLSPVSSCIHFQVWSTLLGHAFSTPKVVLHNAIIQEQLWFGKCNCMSKNLTCSHTNRNSCYCPAYNYTMLLHCIHWLMLTVLLFQSAFANHVNPLLVKWCQKMAPIWLWGPDMAPTFSACLSRTCSGILVCCGNIYTS